MEKIINHWILDYLFKYKLINDKHSRFRQNISTVDLSWSSHLLLVKGSKHYGTQLLWINLHLMDHPNVKLWLRVSLTGDFFIQVLFTIPVSISMPVFFKAQYKFLHYSLSTLISIFQLYLNGRFIFNSLSWDLPTQTHEQKRKILPTVTRFT